MPRSERQALRVAYSRWWLYRANVPAEIQMPQLGMCSRPNQLNLGRRSPATSKLHLLKPLHISKLRQISCYLKSEVN